METTPKKPILFDTCIFIKYLRGEFPARLWIESVLDCQTIGGVSTLTDYELWSGVPNSREEKRYKALLRPFRRFQLHTAIARRAGLLAYPFQKRHDKSISMVDYILAATAEYYHADVLTNNLSHFRKLSLSGVDIFDPEDAPQDGMLKSV